MRKKSGFSLVETMVASVLFSLVLLGLISVFISGGKHITHVRERMTSAQLGKFFLDPLQVYVSQGTWDVADNELRWDGSHNELRLGTRSGADQWINNRRFSETHAVTDVAGTDLRRVTSTIAWTEPSS